MIKNDKRLIFILLIVIIILSCIFIYKLDSTPKYDKDAYAEVYKGYEQILDISSNGASTIDTNTMETNLDITGDTVAILSIPKIDISYPVIGHYSEDNLNIAPTKVTGPEPNNLGNFVIAAHNNLNEAFFSNLDKLNEDDLVELTDKSGRKMKYKVYDVYEVEQNDFSCLNQDTNYKKELTLLTCVKYNRDKRLIVKCISI